MIRRSLALASALLITSCSGGGSTPSAAQPATGPSALALVATTFVIGSPSAPAAVTRRPSYVTANVASVRIALNTVNGAAPPGGLTTTVTTNITLSGCPCTVPGPAVPPGSDAFTLTTYDAQNAGGSAVSTASPTLTIAAGQLNSDTITLEGIPATFVISGLPGGTAGTAFAAQAFAVAVKDADGNTITGTYAQPVSLSDGDATGATTLATSGSDAPPAGKLLSANDVATLAYSGLAIAPATLTAGAVGATSGSATFAPALQPIVYSGPLSGATPEIDLYATSGTGSSGSFTASETGWTNAPYLRTIAAAAAPGCSSIATTAPAAGTSFTTTVVAAPAAGTCMLTLSDFSGGSTTEVTLTYTSSGIGINGRSRS